MNAKIYNGNVQPNPKEYKIWVNDEGLIKTWNGTEWIETASSDSGSGGSGESGGDNKIKYYRVSSLNINETDVSLYLNAVKVKDADGNIMFGPVVLSIMASEVLGCIYTCTKLTNEGETMIVESIYEMLESSGINVPEGTFTEITAEEYWAGL